MKSEKKKNRISLSAQVMWGLLLGIVVGIFFGEKAGILQVVGSAFILLLQMSVLPYIVVSLTAGLGRLTFSDARKLGLRAGLILLIFWVIVLVMVMLMPVAFPDIISASFFSTSMMEERVAFDFLGLYIPANPFQAMATTTVPAMVLFCIAIGIALMGIKNKKVLIEQLDILSDVLMRITQFVAGLAPLGVFALTACAAGTMDVEELGRLQVYLVPYAAVAILLSFWVLPGLIVCLTPLSYKNVIGQTRDALLTAFATGQLLIVLPILADKCKMLVEESAGDSEESSSAVDVLIPVSFNFPNLGKLLSLSFIPFAAWFLDISIPVAQYPNFLISGLASFFGEVVVAMPFLLDLLRIPSDAFQLFISVDVLAGSFGTLLAAMHTVALAILGTFAMNGRLTINRKKLLSFSALTVGLTLLTLVGVRLFFNFSFDPTYTKYQSFIEMKLMQVPVAAKVLSTAEPEPLDPEKSSIERIRQRGSLRVGILKDSLPFVFNNASAELVGLDIEMAHLLAGELGVSLEFVRIDRKNMVKHLDNGSCDIIMSGLAITTDRASAMACTTPYMDLTVGLVVKDHLRDEFRSWEDVQRLGALKVGILNVPYLLNLFRQYLPEAEIVTLESPREFFMEKVEGLDALVFSAEGGSAWTLIYPGYSVVIPLPDPIAVPAAFFMARGNRSLIDYVNTWIALKQKDKTIKKIYNYWILGQGAEKKKPRWCVIRDVLGWVD
jgi:proton glutamate symport protein